MVLVIINIIIIILILDGVLFFNKSGAFLPRCWLFYFSVKMPSAQHDFSNIPAQWIEACGDLFWCICTQLCKQSTGVRAAIIPVWIHAFTPFIPSAV